MKDIYRSLAMPHVCLYFVALYTDAFLVLAPPMFLSTLYVKNKYWLTHSPLPLIHNLLGDQLLSSSRCFPVLTIFHQGAWKVWTTVGFLASTCTTWHDIATGSIQPVPFEDWADDCSIEEAIVASGHPSLYSHSPSIHECLLHRSNDYRAHEKLFTLLTGLDLVWGDASEISWGEVYGSLSVVIPCYNASSTLNDVLDSIYVASTFLPKGVKCEIIIIDDNSTPSLPLCQLPLNMKALRSHQQLFCGGARNVGLTLASGDIVLFLDADTVIAPNYLVNHWIRHQIFPGFVLVSLREYLEETTFSRSRMPVLHQDSRWEATYTTAWKGLIPVNEEITVHPLADSNNFRRFGNGRTIGPTDLPFMVKGNNLSVARLASLAVRFPPHFVGWGPEDVCFGAKLIARGHFVVPVLSTGVFHMNHPPRSGSELRKEQELEANLQRYEQYLHSFAFEDWETTL